MPLLYESLHNHTSLSDGEQTHLEVLATAEKNGFGVIAFTDHESLPDKTTLQQLRAYNGPVEWHIGCEISSGWPPEIGGGPASMFHIVGLFTDPNNHTLLEHCRLANEARKTRMEQIVTNLRSIGLTITIDDCLKISGSEAVGRPHILEAILAHSENHPIIEDLKKQLAAAAKQDPAAKKLYHAMKQAKDDHAPYWLFLSKDSFIKDIYVDYLYWTDMDKTVQIIRGAGGTSILAHWWTVREKISLEQVGNFIRQGRLDGVEVASGFTGPGAANYEKEIRTLADKLGCPQTIGIDAHHKEDFANFVRDKPQAALASVGQITRLLI